MKWLIGVGLNIIQTISDDLYLNTLKAHIKTFHEINTNGNHAASIDSAQDVRSG